MGQFPKASHSTDPSPSHEAEASMTNSGARQSHANLILAVIRAASCPPTSGEIAFALSDEKRTWEVVEVSRRLSDLKTQGKIRMLEARPCRIRVRRMSTWAIAEDDS